MAFRRRWRRPRYNGVASFPAGVAGIGQAGSTDPTGREFGLAAVRANIDEVAGDVAVGRGPTDDRQVVAELFDLEVAHRQQAGALR